MSKPIMSIQKRAFTVEVTIFQHGKKDVVIENKFDSLNRAYSYANNFLKNEMPEESTHNVTDGPSFYENGMFMHDCLTRRKCFNPDYTESRIEKAVTIWLGTERVYED